MERGRYHLVGKRITDILCSKEIIHHGSPGFSLGRLHMGVGICPPPIWGGQVQGDKALMGGLMRGDIDLMGGT